MRNTSANRSNDGMFVRRRTTRPELRQSTDGMKVPSRFLRTSDTPKSSATPPVLDSRRVGQRVAEQLEHNKKASAPAAVGLTAPAESRKPLDIDLTLDDEKGGKKGGNGKRKHRFWPPRKPSKRAWKWIIISFIALILILGGYFAWRILIASSHIFKGNVFEAAFSQTKALKTDQYGRTNLLVFGTSESDPGHPGATLTDSIMIVSIDQKAKTAFLASVPRDLWVKYDTPCDFGYEGKINTVYTCASDSGKNDDAGQKALSNMVGSKFGVDFQYTVHLNLEVLKEAVDALGGVDVTIESSDPRGILDRNFDWRCNYSCYLVKYPNGPAHLDGEHAMFLAQARNDSGGYGLPRSNFDREANQRKIVIAMKEKATSAGFLANPVKVTQFIESLGNNIHTSIDASEIKTFISVAKDLDSKNIQSISLIDQTPAILTTGTGPDGSSIVQPTSGIYDYSSLQNFMKIQLQGLGQLLAENAAVDVLNGSDVSGVAATEADKLEKDGFVIGNLASAPKTQGGIQLYDLSGGKKPVTLKKLQEKLGLSAPTGTTLPAGITSTAPFVVIVGSDAAASLGSSQ